MPWVESFLYLARASLWTGNNHFSSVSTATLNVALIILAAGCLLYGASDARKGAADALRITLPALVLFGTALAYATALQYATRGQAAAGASPCPAARR